MREFFAFYISMYKSMIALPPEQLKEAFQAVCEYAFYGTEPQETGWGRAMLEQCRRVIDRNNKLKKNGEQGGRPPQPNNNQSETKQEPNKNQTETKPEPLQNQTATIKEKVESRKEKDINMSVLQTSVEDESPTPDEDSSADKSPAVRIPYKEIIDYLNEKTGKSFLSTSKDTKKHIRARFNEGFTLDDFKKVIDTMTEKWKGNPNMVDYLRPGTLFNVKFESYLNSIPASHTDQPQVNAKTNAFVFNETKRQRTKEEWLEIERQLLGVHK